MSGKPEKRVQRVGGADDLANVEQTETVHHESTASKRKRPGGVRQLNLTSMLDVTFQLLIFFILTANFAVDEGVLPADLPAGTPPVPTESTPPPDEPITIVLNAVGEDGASIWVQNAKSIPDGDYQELFMTLNGWRFDPAENPGGLYKDDNPIIIKPSPAVKWNHVVSAFNAVIRARYTNVSFAQAG